jgi:hypothetical protein
MHLQNAENDIMISKANATSEALKIEGKCRSAAEC